MKMCRSVSQLDGRWRSHLPVFIDLGRLSNTLLPITIVRYSIIVNFSLSGQWDAGLRRRLDRLNLASFGLAW